LQIAWQATGTLKATLPFACNEDTHMTIRRIPAPMLYGLGTSIRWLRTLSSTMVEPAAAQCQAHWQHGLAPASQPVYHRRAADCAYIR
jgi:hypothetical protein